MTRVRLNPRTSRLLLFGLSAMMMLGGGIATALTLPASTPVAVGRLPQDLESSYSRLNRDIASLIDAQALSGRKVISTQAIETALLRIQLGAESRQYDDTRRQVQELSAKVTAWNAQVSKAPKRTPSQFAPPPELLDVPILLYHYPPANFADQLAYLKDHGYQTVDLDQVSEAMAGRLALPRKPVVITFDDGFSAQMSAFEDLKRFNMKATFYIISSGEGSRWCIGAGRRYGDPLQPATGCGDSYLTWNQVRLLDRSGLVTIGAHTVDHENLVADTPERQWYEITANKAVLERELGHPVRHFCYPYGAYTALTSDLVAQAGFITATTTLPGVLQPAGSVYQLRRIRDALALP